MPRIGDGLVAMSETDLKLLLERIAEGDRAAFRRLYDRTSGKLYGVAIRILKRQDLAEDAVHDTYLKIWDGAAEYRPGLGAPIGWMATITRNRAIDMLRKRSEGRLDDEITNTAADEAVPDPFTETGRRSQLRAFLACLSRLDEKSQRCVLLAYYHGYTHQEIASRMAAPVGTVKSRIRRGLIQIRECLSDD